MHELSIAQSILAIAERTPRNSDAVITGVGLQIGELSGVEIDALQFALSVIRENTVLEQAELEIEIIKGEAQCKECKTVFPMPSFGSCCPACGSYFINILKGREMKVVNLVVDD